MCTLTHFQDDPKVQLAQRVFEKEPADLTLRHLLSLNERMAFVSTVATLLENGFDDAAEFLVEHKDLDLDSPLDFFSVAGLTGPETRADLRKMINRHQGVDEEDMEFEEDEDA